MLSGAASNPRRMVARKSGCQTSSLSRNAPIRPDAAFRQTLRAPGIPRLVSSLMSLVRSAIGEEKCRATSKVSSVEPSSTTTSSKSRSVCWQTLEIARPIMVARLCAGMKTVKWGAPCRCRLVAEAAAGVAAADVASAAAGFAALVRVFRAEAEFRRPEAVRLVAEVI